MYYIIKRDYDLNFDDFQFAAEWKGSETETREDVVTSSPPDQHLHAFPQFHGQIEQPPFALPTRERRSFHFTCSLTHQYNIAQQIFFQWLRTVRISKYRGGRVCFFPGQVCVVND